MLGRIGGGEVEAATKAAELMKLRVLKVAGPELTELAASLQAGRIYASGLGFVPPSDSPHSQGGLSGPLSDSQEAGNGNRIDDRQPCQNGYCRLYWRCDRKPLM
jgi:hypothetical protein